MGQLRRCTDIALGQSAGHHVITSVKHFTYGPHIATHSVDRHSNMLNKVSKFATEVHEAVNLLTNKLNQVHQQ